MTPKWLRPYIAPMRRVLPAFSVLALVGTLLLPTDVQAQSATEKAAARALANEGEAALKKKDFATALEKFDKASRLIPDAITLTLPRRAAPARGRRAGAASWRRRRPS